MFRFKVVSSVFLVIVVSVLSTTNLCAQDVQPFAGLGMGEAIEEYPIGFSLDGKVLISDSGNLWDMESQECITTAEKDRLPAYPSAISPDGKLLAYKTFDYVNSKQVVEIFDVESRESINIFEGKKPVFGLVGKVAFSHDGRMLALGCTYGTEFVDTRNGGRISVTEKLADADTIAFSTDGKLFAHARHFRNLDDEDIIIQLWDVNRGVHFGELDTMGQVHRRWILDVAFSPDGKLLASASVDKRIILWDIATRARTVLREHTDAVDCVTFSPDGKLLASASFDGTVKLWDVQSRKCLVTFQGESRVIFSPDGKVLASGSKDGIILLWEVYLLQSPDAAVRQPVASFIDSSEDSLINTELIFDASNSYAIDGEIVSYQWHSGDGLKKDGEIVSFTYSEEGQYLVKLVISDENGLQACSVRSITVRDPNSVTPQGKQPTTWGWVRQTKVFQNYPNPFNPETWIPYQLAEEGEVVIQIFSATGELIMQLKPGHKPAGLYLDKTKAAYWNGYDSAGESVASGVYFYRLQVGDFIETIKMVILK